MKYRLRTRICGALLASGLLLSCISAPMAAESTDLSGYADMKPDDKAWYYDTMAWGVEQGIVSGYEESGQKLLRPERQVTEAEFLAMLLRFFPDTKEAAGRLARPQAETNWSDPFYKAAALYRVPVTGTELSDHRHTPVRRGQVARMIASAFGRGYSVSESIEFLYEKKLSEGRTGKSVEGFEQEGLLTRAEAVRFLELLARGEYGGRFVVPEGADRNPAIVSDKGKALSRLGIYYGIPSLVNGADGDLAKALQAFEPFEMLIFGSGVEDPEYADYARSSKVVTALSEQGKRIFGYVDLGVSTSDLTYARMELAVDQWKRLGASGIYLDDAGYDFGVTRERQSHMIDYIHRSGLNVFLGAWNPDDVSGDYDEKGNYAPSLVGEGDWYLSESWLVGKGEYMPFDLWQDKIAKSMYYQAKKGIRTAAVSTVAEDSAQADDGGSERFAFAWWAAAMYGIPMQWTDFHYSATTSTLHYYPDLAPDLDFIGTGRPIAVSPSQTIMRTGEGAISINGDGKRFGRAAYHLPTGGKKPVPGMEGKDWASIPVYAQNGQSVLKVAGSDQSIRISLTGLRPAVRTQLLIHTGKPAGERLNVVHWQGYKADMLLEGNRLYRYAGDGNTWEWTLIRTLDASGYAADPSGTAIGIVLDKADLSLETGELHLLQLGYISDDKPDTAIPSADHQVPMFLDL
ncbi:S-layer homology domain-containing protein [Paenibacillus contaminans]|uniref:SLH domain-containing protein n=1 Tax=Paenibacillus contaminans TaxID=450362 RepID=A0A329MI02_9BACL|nr:S-layer homology domain-containing protein [Paenibacillus contaminans]RAV19360.1 hypothetical protein DQG23_20395 [Paenibacillus contaminans]